MYLKRSNRFQFVIPGWQYQVQTIMSGVSAVLCLLSVFFLHFSFLSTPETITTDIALSGLSSNLQPDQPLQLPLSVERIVTQAGDSLSTIFQEMDLPARTLQYILQTTHGAQLTDLRPGQTLFYERSQSSLRRLMWMIHPLEYYVFSRDSTGFSSEHILLEPEWRTRRVRGEVAHSLFVDGLKSGLSAKIILDLVDIFAWKIDFSRDLRPGDHFKILLDDAYLNDKALDTSKIVAAEIICNDRQTVAVRYRDQSDHIGYYTPDGKSLQGSFLKAPLQFSRISSRFSTGRRHPVLHIIRAHKGVDYAAKVNTPVRATGDARVEFAGWKGGYGRTVVLKHAGRYATLYAHLNSIRADVRKSARVQQGDIIGFVGSTGLATGPHLHYEFLVNGVHKDPLHIPFSSSRQIAPEEKEQFDQLVQEVLQSLSEA